MCLVLTRTADPRTLKRQLNAHAHLENHRGNNSPVYMFDSISHLFVMHFAFMRGSNFTDDPLRTFGSCKCASPWGTASLVGEIISLFTDVRSNRRISVPMTVSATSVRLDRTVWPLSKEAKSWNDT